MKLDLEELKKIFNLTDEDIVKILYEWIYKIYFRVICFILQLKTIQEKLDG